MRFWSSSDWKPIPDDVVVGGLAGAAHSGMATQVEVEALRLRDGGIDDCAGENVEGSSLLARRIRRKQPGVMALVDYRQCYFGIVSFSSHLSKCLL